MRTINFISHIKQGLPNKNYYYFLLLLPVLFFTFWAYTPTLDNHFLSWDDQYYVTNNPYIQQPTLESLKTLANQVVSLNYHPLTMMSLWANAKLTGTLTASPFIWTNVLLHLANTAFAFLLTYKLSEREWLVALATAALFGLHPMHIESVAWISERKDVLYTFFFLASMYSYTKYTSDSKWQYLALSFLLFAASCLSKAMAVALVPTLFLIDLIKHRNLKNTSVYIEKIPFALLALLIGSIAISVQGGGDFYGLLSLSENTAAISMDVSFLDRIKNAAFANYYYLKNFLLPTSFSAYHPYSLADSLSPFFTGLTAMVLLASILLAYLKKEYHLLFSLGFYLATIGLVLQLIPVGSAVVAERYTYLPYLGLGYGAGHLLERVSRSLGNYLPTIGLMVISSVMGYTTSQQADMWQDHISLFGQAADQYPEDPFIRKTLASGYWKEGKLDSAQHHIKYAIDNLGLTTSPAFELLANCYADKGESRKAMAFFNEAVRIDSHNISARYHRGLELLKYDPAKAIADFNYCANASNDYVRSLVYGPRGRAYGLQGEYDLALSDLNQAITRHPNDVNGYLDRAVTYERLLKKELAYADYLKVLSLDANNTYAKERLDILHIDNL